MGATPPGFLLNGDGSYTFDPSHPAYNSLSQGVEQVRTVNFQVSDGTDTDSGVLTIHVMGVNDDPVFAEPNTVSGDEDTTLNGSVSATDVEGDPLTYSLNTGPTHGMVIVRDLYLCP